MTRTRSLLLPALLAIAVVSCRSDEPAPPSPAAEPTAAGSTAAGEVAYEPAYPAEVSSEGLSEDDVAQQEGVHAHGGDEHAHGGDEHAHDGAAHSHDEDGGSTDHDHEH